MFLYIAHTRLMLLENNLLQVAVMFPSSKSGVCNFESTFDC